MKEAILFPERLHISPRVGLLGLERHIRVCDLRNGAEVKHARQQEHKTRNGQINPLHVLQGLCIICRLEEEHVATQDRRNDRSDAIEGLREVDTEFGVAWWTADSNIGVCGGFETAEAVADDKDGGAETFELISIGCSQPRRILASE
jgi:hypothetical protein